MDAGDIARLRLIGLTEGEIKVYRALLQQGASTKTRLVKAAGIAPANLYDITDRLAKKGIISIAEKDGVKQFSPGNPRQLLAFVEQKKRDLESEQRIVTAMLPSLHAMYLEHRQGVNVEIFTGWRGLKTVFDDLLEECVPGDRCFVSGATEGAQDAKADRFFLKYSRLRAQKGIRLSIIFNERLRGRKERMQFFRSSRMCEARFLEQNTLAETMIYRDVTAILVVTENPVAIRIRGKEVADNFLQQFSALWKMAKK